MKIHLQLFFTLPALVVFLALGVSAQPASAQAKAKAQWLPLCGKCASPTVFAKSGIGTAHAVAKAKMTFEDAKENCQSYSMDDHPDCDKEAKETLKEENGKVYTATADCVHGKLTIADGESFIYAGIWPSGYLKGKTRWRWGPGSGEDTGKFADENGPTNGFMVDTTSKIVCPNGIGAGKHN